MTEIFAPKTQHYNIRKPTMLVIHGIGTSLEKADAILSGQSEYEASAHYLITQDGEVRQYLDESVRAWHAGLSYWSGMTDINSLAIGIELESKPEIADEKDFHLTFYSEPQIKTLAELVQGITERNRIAPAFILAHQDIAPYRKADPGPNFDWQNLADHKVGLWHDLQKPSQDPIVKDRQIEQAFKRNLTMFGYDSRPDTGGKDYSHVIRAFQTHFLPWNICGEVTEQSVQAIDILLEKKFA